MFEKRSKFFALSDEGSLATFVFAMRIPIKVAD